MHNVFFQIRNSRTRRAKPCAFMSYSPEAGYEISIEPHVSENDVPAYFVPFVQRGQLCIDNEQSLRWLQERIPPPGRHNLGEILKAHGINEYSELELLRSSRGESSQDDFVLEEITQEEFLNRAVAKGSDRKKQLGNALKSRRIGLDMSQRELADSIGIGQSLLSRIEAGQSNVTFDILADLDEKVSNGNRSLLSLPRHNLWTNDRWRLFNLLEERAPNLASLYMRLIDELEDYSENDASALTDSRIVSHCFREFMNAFPDYIDEERLQQSTQAQEQTAMRKVKELLRATPLHLEEESGFAPIPTELANALWNLQQASKAGASNNKDRMAAAVSDTDSNAPLAAWESVRSLAMETAHLPRGGRENIPDLSQYLENLRILEHTIQGRIGSVFDVKTNLNEIIQRANLVDSHGRFTPPEGNEIMEFISLLGDRHLRTRAFAELKNPLWLHGLKEHGLFESYKQEKTSPDKSYFDPTPYLELCATVDPETTFFILNSLSSAENYSIRLAFLRVAAFFPACQQAEAIAIFNQWASTNFGLETDFWNPYLLELLIKSAFEKNDPNVRKVSKQFLQNLFTVRVAEKLGDHPFTQTAALLPRYSYQRLASVVSEMLTVRERMTLSRRLIVLYYKTIDIPISSRILACTLEEEDLGRHHARGFHLFPWIKIYKQALVEEVEESINSKTLAPNFEYPLLTRTAMFALHERLNTESKQPPSGTVTALMEFLATDCIFDSEYEMEAVPLIGDFATIASFDEKQAFLLALPHRLDSWEKQQKAVIREGGHGDKERLDRVSTRRELNEHAILSQFNPEDLPSANRQTADKLASKYGEYQGPTPLFKVFTVSGPNSPISDEELLAMSPEQTLGALKTWRPSDSDLLSDTNREGFARAITRVIKENPSFFNSANDGALTLEPIYLYGLLDGWREAAEAEIAFLLELPLAVSEHAMELCRYAAEKGLASATSFDGISPDELLTMTGWFLKSLPEADGFAIDEKTMELILFQLIQLHELSGSLQDADILIDNECSLLGALNMTLNAPCPIAISGIVAWLASDNPKSVVARELALTTLEKAFPNNGPLDSSAIALANRLAHLMDNERKWLDAHFEELFGGEAPIRAQRRFLAIVVQSFCLNESLFLFLQPAIESALANHLEGYSFEKQDGPEDSFNFSLGLWLYQLAAVGNLDICDPMIAAWQQNASPAERGCVIGRLCQFVGQTPGTTTAIAINVMKLWGQHAEKFQADSESLNGALELMESGLLPDNWIRDALLVEAHRRNLIADLQFGLDRLEDLAHSAPAWGVIFLRTILENDPDRNAYNYRVLAYHLLARYAELNSESQSGDFRFCMNELGRMGLIDLDEKLGVTHRDQPH